MCYLPLRWSGLAMVLVLWVTCCLGGCTVGPQTVPRDRSAYAESMAQSAREQLLLNIIRLRYMESPVFMSVNSVVNQLTNPNIKTE